MRRPKSTASTSPNTGSAPTTKRPLNSLAGGGSSLPLPLPSPPPTHVPPANEQTGQGRSGDEPSGPFLFQVFGLHRCLCGLVLGAFRAARASLARARLRARPVLWWAGSARWRGWAYTRSAAITKSAQRSPIMIEGALVLPPTILGITLASATHRPSSPLSFRVGSTTALSSAPMRQVPTG